MKWRTLKDKSEVLINGRNRVLRIFKRPHGGYACFVFKHGALVAMNGYHATALPKKYNAVRWGISKATQLKLIDANVYKEYKDDVSWLNQGEGSQRSVATKDQSK